MAREWIGITVKRAVAAHQQVSVDSISDETLLGRKALEIISDINDSMIVIVSPGDDAQTVTVGMVIAKCEEQIGF